MSSFTIDMENTVQSVCIDKVKDYHKLKHKWTLFYHLINNNDWSINGYTKICDFEYIEDIIYILNCINDNIITTVGLFIMKKGIKPMWEDPKNAKGGAFSYRISNQYVGETFKDLAYVLMGETISNDLSFVNDICGITVSPKKSFCVMKVWMSNYTHINPSVITSGIKHFAPKTAIFMKHTDKK